MLWPVVRFPNRTSAIKWLLRLAGAILLISGVALVGLQQFLGKVGATVSPVAEITIEGRRVALWKPVGPAPEKGYPLLLFSHGFTGCNTQSVDLMEALAKAGYFVLAPNHHDAVCGSALRDGQWYPVKLFELLHTTPSRKPFSKPALWDDTTYKDREQDLQTVLDAVLRAGAFEGVTVDPARIGLAGHSLGGYTVLGMAGAWLSWKDARIKAVLALSPYCAPFVIKGDLGHLGVPVMYQGGTLDLGITPSVRRTGGAYDRTSAPKYYVEFDGAGHLAWTNLSKQYQPLIASYAVQFFDSYLKGVPGSVESLANIQKSKLVSTHKAKAD